MNRMIIPIIILMIPTPAMADWQYTKWGMTPDQVVAASGGDAQMDSAGKVVGVYSASGRSYKLFFSFHAAGLDKVLLHSESDCTQIGEELLAAYGTPIEKTGGQIPKTQWLDPKRGNVVRFLVPMPGFCSIDYGPMPTSSGL